jgi:hypothetical protein
MRPNTPYMGYLRLKALNLPSVVALHLGILLEIWLYMLYSKQAGLLPYFLV